MDASSVSMAMGAAAVEGKFGHLKHKETKLNVSLPYFVIFFQNCFSFTVTYHIPPNKHTCG